MSVNPLVGDIKEAFDSILGESKVISTSIESIRSQQNLKSDVVNYSEQDRQLDADRLIAIKQSTSKGFRVLDINPNIMSKADFFCKYQDDVLRQYVGNENVVETGTVKFDNVGSPNNGANVQAPYWRSIEIPIQGSFLKIEFLPIRQNQSVGQSATQPTQFSSNTDPQNTTSEVNGAYFVSPEISSTNIILLDFENITISPLIVKNGMVYKTYFNSIILTFKQLSPLIRVTIGVESEIVDESTPPQSLSLWDAKSFLDSTLQAPKPFCITDKDFSGTYGLRTDLLPVGTPVYYQVITNPKSTVSPTGPLVDRGMAIFWLTEFSAFMSSAIFPDAVNSSVQTFDVELFIIDTSNLPTLNVLERVAAVSCSFICGTGQFGPNSSQFQFNEPIRVCLKANQALYIRMLPVTRTMTGTTQIWLKWHIAGYCYGSLNAITDGTGINVGPYVPSKLLVENPYAADLVKYGVPNV